MSDALDNLHLLYRRHQYDPAGATPMNSFERRVAALYDLYPLEYALALAKEGYGDYTPFLLPNEERAPVVDPRAAAVRSFEEMRREEISRLEALVPRALVGVREAWEAWWAVRRGG